MFERRNILRFRDKTINLECFTKKTFWDFRKIILNVLQENILGFQKNNLECFTRKHFGISEKILNASNEEGIPRLSNDILQFGYIKTIFI